MRGRFILSGIALAAFAATLLATGWPSHPVPAAHVAAPAVPSSPALVPARPAPSVSSGSSVPAITERSTESDAVDNQAPQPTLPDASALPSYERDQAARNAQALGSARSR